MNLRYISNIYGVLILLSFVAGVFSSIQLLEYPGYLEDLSSLSSSVYRATFFQALMAIVYTAIAALLYPLVRDYSRELASLYFAFRLTGAFFLYCGIVTLLAPLFLSESYVAMGSPENPTFEIVAELLRLIRGWMNHGGMILPWNIGGLILYFVFFKTELLPRWFSLCGVISVLLTLIVTFLFLFGLVEITTPIYFAFNGPTALFEISLSIYLIIKGFNKHSR